MGGGEIKSTPGVARRTSAIHGQTLCPGSCPPSPGFALELFYLNIISITKHSLVTPNLPEVACLIAERRRPFDQVYTLRVPTALTSI